MALSPASLTQGHPTNRTHLPPVQTPKFNDLESWMDYHAADMGQPIDKQTGMFKAGRFKGMLPNAVPKYLETLGIQSGFKPRAQMAPATAPSTTPVAPTATPPTATAPSTTPVAPTATAPPRPSMINGQTSTAFFQDAANRQGRSNSYGRVQPQAPVAPPAAPAQQAAVAKHSAAVDAKFPVLFGKPGQATATRELATNTAPAAAGSMNPAAAAVTKALASLPRPTMAPATNTLAQMEKVANSMPRPSMDLTKMPTNPRVVVR